MPTPRSVGRRLTARRRRAPLPSLYEAYPRAAQAMRRPHGVQVVALEKIVGTVRNPTQNTIDFLPLPQLRGRNWMARWQRIQQATSQLTVLPPVELVRVGDEYYVSDGHNRIAAAKLAGAVAIDADVTELLLAGASGSVEPEQHDAPTVLVGADELQQAATGRQSRTAIHRSRVDELRREELLEREDP